MKEQLLEILKGFHSDVDFDKETALVDDQILDSLDIVALVGEMQEAFDVTISIEDIVPENFNSVQAMLAMLNSLAD